MDWKTKLKTLPIETMSDPEIAHFIDTVMVPGWQQQFISEAFEPQDTAYVG